MVILKDDCIEVMKQTTPLLLTYTYSIREMRVLRDRIIFPIKRNT